MATFGERLKQLRKMRNLSQKELAKQFGTTQGLISSYEKNEKSPDQTRLLEIADYFGVTLDYLLGRETDVTDRVNKYKLIDVPVLGKIPAGDPYNAEENIIEWTKVPNTGNYKEGDLFMLIVDGDSMEGKSRICAGDRVLVKVQSDVENGEIAVVNINGEDATLKRVKKTPTGQVFLYPDNPKYDPILITDENARICGKVIQVIFEPK